MIAVFLLSLEETERIAFDQLAISFKSTVLDIGFNGFLRIAVTIHDHAACRTARHSLQSQLTAATKQIKNLSTLNIPLDNIEYRLLHTIGSWSGMKPLRCLQTLSSGSSRNDPHCLFSLK